MRPIVGCSVHFCGLSFLLQPSKSHQSINHRTGGPKEGLVEALIAHHLNQVTLPPGGLVSPMCVFSHGVLLPKHLPLQNSFTLQAPKKRGGQQAPPFFPTAMYRLHGF